MTTMQKIKDIEDEVRCSAGRTEFYVATSNVYLAGQARGRPVPELAEF